jgi:hypothetical protein
VISAINACRTPPVDSSVSMPVTVLIAHEIVDQVAFLSGTPAVVTPFEVIGNAVPVEDTARESRD